METDSDIDKGKNLRRVVVKGYMRPDGTSYYVSIPREIRDVFGLKGGEYFVMEAKKEKQKISLKIVKFSDD
jgi:Holliday junction resolvase